MQSFTFPFDTCETPNNTGIAQPYSLIVNLIIICVIFYFFLISGCLTFREASKQRIDVKCKSFPSALLLLSILCFEIFHTFSHMVHIPGNIQTYIVHFFAYCVNSSLFYLLYRYTSKFPSNGFLLYLCLLILLDLYALTHMKFIIYVATQSTIFLSLLFYFYSWLSSHVKLGIKMVFILSILGIILELNELYNCKTMLSYFPGFPFHVFIETTVLAIFVVVSSIFTKYEKS